MKFSHTHFLEDQKETQQRVTNLVDAYDSSKPNSTLYLYVTSPLDYFEKWKPLTSFGYIESLDRLNNSACEHIPSGSFSQINQLLVHGLFKFGHLFESDWNGTPLHYCVVPPHQPEPYKHLRCNETVICIKVVNNGTVYGMSFSPHVGPNLPHDFGCDWEIEDAIEVRSIPVKKLENIAIKETDHLTTYTRRILNPTQPLKNN